MKAASLIFLCSILSACTSPQSTSVHEQLRQHILEAELGSAIHISFAKAPSIPLPADQDETVLINQLQDSNKQVRWTAADKLSYSSNKDVVLALIQAMNDKAGTQRVCVMAQALGHLKDPRALSALTQAAFDPYNRDLRLCAIRSIGMIGDRSAVPDLIMALKQNNTPIQTANSLARIGDVRAVKPLIEAAGNDDIRPWMIRALGELGNRQAVAYLAAELEREAVKKNAKQYALINESLWKISLLDQTGNQYEGLNKDQGDVISALSEVLISNQDENRRMWAAYRLGEIHDVASVNSLIEGLRDESIEVTGRAAAALVRLKPYSLKAVRVALNNSIVTGKKSNSNTPDLQHLYLYAVIAYIGDTGDIQTLETVHNTYTAAEEVIKESLQLLNGEL